MRILILEDELAAAQRLTRMLQELRQSITIAGTLETVADAKIWFRNHPLPDLVISDIQLADGLSFEALNELTGAVPVIFTTAYDSYMLRAFKLNSVDYILKPYDKDELEAAISKYEKVHRAGTLDKAILAMLQQLPHSGKSYRTRFLIKLGERFVYIPATEVLFFRADDKLVFLHTREQKYIVEETMEELEQCLDPAQFFRINRSYLIQVHAIAKIHSHFNGRLKLELNTIREEDIFVSRQRVAEFKAWLNA